jgi:hypothetical protein
MPRDHQHVLDPLIVETLEQHAFTNHAGGTEDDDFHERIDHRGRDDRNGSLLDVPVP